MSDGLILFANGWSIPKNSLCNNAIGLPVCGFYLGCKVAWWNVWFRLAKMFGQHDGKMMLTEIGRGSTNTIENAHGRLHCIRGRRSLQKMWRSLLLLCRWDGGAPKVDKVDKVWPFLQFLQELTYLAIWDPEIKPGLVPEENAKELTERGGSASWNTGVCDILWLCCVFLWRCWLAVPGRWDSWPTIQWSTSTWGCDNFQSYSNNWISTGICRGESFGYQIKPSSLAPRVRLACMGMHTWATSCGTTGSWDWLTSTWHRWVPLALCPGSVAITHAASKYSKWTQVRSKQVGCTINGFYLSFKVRALVWPRHVLVLIDF